MKTKLLKGNNIELLKTLEPNSIDSVLTDAPYGLSFMNKKWDYDVPSVEFWKEVYRVLKPGGHILCFGGTRTYHRMVVNIEDAGFEIRDCIQWIYGSGFPKSLNIGKAMDKLEGKEVFVGKGFNVAGQGIGLNQNKELRSDNPNYIKPIYQNEWDGWGTGLKPANEPIVLARKPLDKKTIVQNVKEWGTGGINIDGCRVGSEKVSTHSNGKGNTGDNGIYGKYQNIQGGDEREGRFPANVILDEEAAEVMDEQSGILKSGDIKPHKQKDKTWKFACDEVTSSFKGDSGGASRFFYVAKVSKKERNMGLDNFEEKDTIITNQSKKCANCNKWELAASGDEYVCKCEEPNWNNNKQKNNHPTVKPINLLTYLVRMITPPDGVVLDAYMGSGSTGIATLLEGFNFVGMEMDEDYFNIAEARINNYEQYRKLLK